MPSSLSTTPDLRLTHRCVHLCVSMLNHFQDQRTMSGLLKNWFRFMPVQTCVAECAWNVGYIYHLGASFFEDVPLVEFMYLVFTHMPGELL